MDRSDFCGCKGVRTCIKCEEAFGYENKNVVEFTEHTYVYCPYCNKAWQGVDMNSYQSHPNHTGKSFNIDGIYIQEDFLSEVEAEEVLSNLDALPWDKSQSGRRKQVNYENNMESHSTNNFGPKCNFKRQKIKLGDFQGFPASTKFIQDRFEQDAVLKNFQTIEQCTLEYDSQNGSSIDNHIDDCWIWGERIVTVNVIGDSVLTLRYYEGDSNKYNLNCGCYSYQKKYTTVESCKENKEPNNHINSKTLGTNRTTNSTMGEKSPPCPTPSTASSNIQPPNENSTIPNTKPSSDTICIGTTQKPTSSENTIRNQILCQESSKNHISPEKSTLEHSTNTVLESTTLSQNHPPTVSVPDYLSSVVIRIPMPARSLLVLYGEARYEWQHCVLRSDVIGRRVCIAYREFTEPYLDNPATADVFEKAKCFF